MRTGMSVRVEKNGKLLIDNAKICYRNFSGEGSKFNREGDRNFSLIIDDENLANDLISDGWNVKVKDARELGDSPFMTIPVKIKFNERGPAIYLSSAGNQIQLSEDNIGMLDRIDILSVDMDLRPYDWEMNGKTGRTAYLDALYVVQNVDRFANRLAESEFPRE